MNVKRDAIATFDQIIKNGLEPYDKVIEYSCDGLELGRYLILYLDRGNYWGISDEPAVTADAIRYENLTGLIKYKKPTLDSTGNSPDKLNNPEKYWQIWNTDMKWDWVEGR
tara:strand:- start:936 stop:1268 length:333 start_codon:yes stop_codon:yes gene_type:complete